jgi:hypothetical protein
MIAYTLHFVANRLNVDICVDRRYQKLDLRLCTRLNLGFYGGEGHRQVSNQLEAEVNRSL